MSSIPTRAANLIVFVSGGTGALGQPVIRQLLDAGHLVHALAHTQAADATLRALGAEPVRADLFDPESLVAAVAGADAVLHLATRIPPTAKSGDRRAWQANDRIRREGTRNLVEAARAADVRTFVYPSFAFVYPDRGDSWVDAQSQPPAQPPHPLLESTLDAEAEIDRFTASGRRGVVLRMGGFYGPGNSHTLELRDAARRGLSLLPGPADAYLPAIWVDDAASAVVAALAPDVPAGTYDVVDDQPLRRRETARAVTAAVGRRWLLTIPSPVVRLLSPTAARLFSLSLRISNQLFKQASGWTPSVPNAQIGWQRLGAQWATRRTPVAAGRGVLFALALLFMQTLVGGLWVLLSPAAFYAEFPGFGRMWVSVDGPYNEHLLRDFGSLSLALSVVLLFALMRREAPLVRVAALAALAGALPHFVYHALHLDLLITDADRVLQTLALAVIPLIATWILIRVRPTDGGAVRTTRQTGVEPVGRVGVRDYQSSRRA